MKNNIFDLVSGGFSIFSLTVATQVKDILNIILIILSIINLGLILFFKIKDALKDGKIDDQEKEDIKEATTELIDKIEDLSDTIEDKKEGDK